MIKNNSSISQLKVIYLATTLFLVGLSLYAFNQVMNLIDSAQLMHDTNEINMSLEKIATAVNEAETNQRGFLLTGDALLLYKRDKAFTKLSTELKRVDSLLRDPKQIENLKTLHVAIDEKLLSMKKVLELYSPIETNPEFKANIVEGIGKMDKVRQELYKMALTEEELLHQRTEKYYRLSFVTPFFIIVLFFGALIILSVSYFRINSAFKESQQLHSKLEEEKTLAQTILNCSPDNIIVLNKDLQYITANTKAQQIIHQITPAFIGKKVTDLFPSTDAINDMYKALQGETVYRNDFYSAATDLHFEVIYTPLIRGNEVIGIIAQSRDITGILKTNRQLEKQNEELEERNNFVETLINASVDIIIVLDKELRFVSVNKKTVEIYADYYPKSMIGELFSEVFPNAPLEPIKEAFEGRNTVLKKLKSAVFDKYYEVNYIPLFNKNEVYAVMTITHDITERIKAEEEIRTLNQTYQYAEQIGMFGSYRYNFQKQQLEYSDNLYRLLGCEPQEFTAGPDNFIKYVHPEDVQYVLDATNQAFSHKHFSKWEYRMICKDGSMIYVRGTGQILTDSEGVQWMIGTLQNITEEKNQQSILNAKNVALEKMNKELESFAYISSHDLQEPLRKIQTFATRIVERESKNLSESTIDNLKRMQNAATRMQTLIQDLLAYSRTNSTERRFETVDLNDIIEEVKDELKDELEEKKAVIETTDLGKLTIIPFQFRQMMLNLVSNSLKFSHPNKPAVIKIKRETGLGIKFQNDKLIPHVKYCYLSISDNGIGFEPQYSEKIFEVFQRLHIRTEYKGTGIGLAIVKKIVENHNGIITAKGQVNGGATFDIYIPLN